MITSTGHSMALEAKMQALHIPTSKVNELILLGHRDGRGTCK